MANVQNMPAGLSMVDEVAKRLLADTAGNPLRLSDTMIIVPTRRAVINLKDAFIRQSGGAVFLLPKIVPLSNLEDTALFDDEDILPAVDGFERKSILISMIMADYAKYGVDNPTVDKAAALADTLAAFLDEAEEADVDLKNIKNLVPDEFAFHLQSILSFLELIVLDYPKLIKAKGKINAAARKMQLIYKRAEKWEKEPAGHPVIAVGITGSLPASAKLLTVIANMENGLVILPALDKDADDEYWQAIDETHPQFEMKKLLEKMGVDRRLVKDFAACDDKNFKQKSVFMAEVMRPSKVTDKWRDVKGKFTQDAFADVKKIEAENEADEALAAALILRGVLEEKGKRAILVTGDRKLAKRVKVQMQRWGVETDDSAGQKLGDTEVGTFLNLMADAATEQSDAKMLALLKHPLTAAGMAMVDFRLQVRKWEKEKRKSHPDLAKILELDPRPEDKCPAWGEFCALFRGENVPFADILSAHIKAAEQLATSADRTGAERLWKGDDGQEASDMLSKVLAYSDYIGKINPVYYAALLKNFMSGVTVRPKYGFHPRLDILGPIEARLQTADVVVVAGLNEGSFPKLPEADPWLSRQMRADLGLPSKDENIGIAAHDFAELFAFAKVFLLRSKKEGGVPSIPSRWLMRMEAVLEASGIKDAIVESEFGKVAEQLDMPDVNSIKAISPPRAKPPVEVRPKKLSVTKIESWMRDPYSIYARYVLKLEPLKEQDYQTGQSEYGSAIHKAFEDFITNFGNKLPKEPVKELLDLGKKAFAEQGITGASLAFYWPCFERIAVWFVGRTRQEQNAILRTICEAKGEVEIPYDGGIFTLTGRADRIDVMTDGTVRIVDYKTGTPPKEKQILAGFAPQLPLEAMMIKKGAFKDIALPADAKVTGLQYWKVSGRNSGSEVIDFHPKDSDIATEINKAESGLVALLNKFNDPDTEFLATPRFSAAPKYSDYEYLERIKEWAVKGDDDTDGEE